ncbi:hypothetical protein V8C35DRAFT_279887 [Trichoderma chlorosporum]
MISAIATVSFWLPSTLSSDVTTSQGLFITFTIMYGIFASAYVALFPASLVELFGIHNFASVNGVLAYKGTTLLTSVLLFAASFAVVWVRMEAMVGVDGKLVKK